MNSINDENNQQQQQHHIEERFEYSRGVPCLLNSPAGPTIKEFNSLAYGDNTGRDKIIRELFGSVGEDCCIEHNFHCDLGFNIHVGNRFYAGFNCTILDAAAVVIGNNVLLGPNVGIYTAGHYVTPPQDRHLTGYATPITIGDNVWVGGHTVILGGVKIGDNSIIAASSVVTKDIPPNTIYAGNPAKKIKDIISKL